MSVANQSRFALKIISNPVWRRFCEAPNLVVNFTTRASQKRGYNSKRHLGNTPYSLCIRLWLRPETSSTSAPQLCHNWGHEPAPGQPMNPTILLVLMGCLFGGMNAGYYFARLFYSSTNSGSLGIGMLLGAMVGVLLLSKPVMKFVARSLQDGQRVRLKMFSLAVVILFLALLAAVNAKTLH
jgi:hypothetical protein